MNLKRVNTTRDLKTKIMLISSVCAGALGLLPQQALGKLFNPIMLSQNGSASDMAVVIWSAFGSGCRAVEEIPSKDRDVNLNIRPGNIVNEPKLLLQLALPQFRLDAGKQVLKDHATELYSECALRFGIRGQPGRRLKHIDGYVRMDIQKQRGATLLLLNELRFGQFGGDEKKIEYDDQSEIKKTSIEISLSKELSPTRDDGKSSCGSDQLLFYDFTLFSRKTNKAAQVGASIAAPGEARVRLQYEPC